MVRTIFHLLPFDKEVVNLSRINLWPCKDDVLIASRGGLKDLGGQVI